MKNDFREGTPFPCLRSTKSRISFLEHDILESNELLEDEGDM
jgi:hypothetical protein